MKNFVLPLILMLALPSYSYADELAPDEFNLGGKAITVSQPIVKQTRNKEEILEDIRKSIESIQRTVENMNKQQPVVTQPAPVPQQPTVVVNPAPVHAPRTVVVNPIPRPQPQQAIVQQPRQPPKTAPASDGGPNWTFDPVTNSYFRYVPNTPRAQPRVMQPQPMVPAGGRCPT